MFKFEFSLCNLVNYEFKNMVKMSKNLKMCVVLEYCFENNDFMI